MKKDRSMLQPKGPATLTVIRVHRPLLPEEPRGMLFEPSMLYRMKGREDRNPPNVGPSVRQQARASKRMHVISLARPYKQSCFGIHPKTLAALSTTTDKLGWGRPQTDDGFRMAVAKGNSADRVQQSRVIPLDVSKEAESAWCWQVCHPPDGFGSSTDEAPTWRQQRPVPLFPSGPDLWLYGGSDLVLSCV